MDWALVRADFEWDGSWRDIYVLGATSQDWARASDALKALVPPPTFRLGDYSGQMPDQIDWSTVFCGERAFLAATVGRITFNCHFFEESEIEFDLDPRSIDGPKDLADLACFMKMLGVATGKTVILTHENCQQAVIARFETGSSCVVWSSEREANATDEA